MKARAPNVLLCMLLLAAVDLSLRMFGFRRTVRWSRQLTRSKGLASEAELVGKTIQRLLTATAFYPGRSRCLEQSIAGFILLRRRGFDVRLRLGVQPALVAVLGHDVGDVDDLAVAGARLVEAERDEGRAPGLIRRASCRAERRVVVGSLFEAEV